MKILKRRTKNLGIGTLAILLILVVTVLSACTTNGTPESTYISIPAAQGQTQEATSKEATSKEATSKEVTSKEVSPVEDSNFEIHYIDVGQGVSALVLCDNSSMLIDGGSAEDSSLVYSYLKKLDISHLDYIVCSHAHGDHVGGLSGALNYATVGKAFAPVESDDSKAFSDFTKHLEKQGKSITIPEVGDTFSLGSATVTVIGINKTAEDVNNTSIVLRIEYGETSFLFTGDAEREAEQDILESGFTLSSTVLKVGHHGSNTSTSYPFLREVMPKYAVISVGADNPYEHPTENTLSRLRDADVEVYRTDLQGDIICTSNGKEVFFEVEKDTGNNIEEVIHTEIDFEQEYVLNTSTKKFHYPECSSVANMKDKNKEVYKGPREDVIEKGYSPCGRCKP